MTADRLLTGSCSGTLGHVAGSRIVPGAQRQISLEHDDLAGPAGLASETVTLQLTRHRPDPGGPRLPRPGWPRGPATAGLIRHEWLAVLCGGFAVFAAVTAVISADPAQRAWGMFAT